MMKPMILIWILMLPVLAAAQEVNELRPVSVIKENGVKTRAIGPAGGSKARAVCSFDREGKLTLWMLTDNETGKRPQARITYRYDDKGHPASALEVDGRDSLHTVYEYNAAGRLTRKVVRLPDSTIAEMMEYAYDPYIEVASTFWGDEEVYRKDTSVYDASGHSVRFSGTDLRDSTSTRTWSYAFEKELDAAGRLRRKRTRSEGKVISVEEFVYDKRGLLLSKETTHSMMGGFKTKELYTYTFY
ncbi:MAG: hypothetical protein EOO11_05305 [Chitinophagaceae bacterium]|nr:MAG: hypothetical protein EOO11_05305 [Chitinophagaceae bacterium]